MIAKAWLKRPKVVHMGLEKLIAEKNPLMSADDQEIWEPGGRVKQCSLAFRNIERFKMIQAFQLFDHPPCP